MNVFCIVGQIERLPVLKETSTGLKTCEVELKVKGNLRTTISRLKFGED